MNSQNTVEPNGTTGRRGTSRRAVLTAGTGAALTAAAATGAGASPAEAAPRSGGTRIPVAPGVEVNIAALNGGRRGTVVFVPGWLLASTTPEYTLLFLADHGYRAIALDQRGSGLSDAPYGPYGYDVWVRDIRTVLEALSLRDVMLVGHSMGGAVALRHAARFGGRVGKLVVAEPAAPRFVYGPNSADLAAGLDALISGYASDLTADLARITVPTRVFHAINDKIVPLDHGQAVAAGIRHARLVTFATAGHGVYVDERDTFNAELLAFIR